MQGSGIICPMSAGGLRGEIPGTRLTVQALLTSQDRGLDGAGTTSTGVVHEGGYSAHMTAGQLTAAIPR